MRQREGEVDCGAISVRPFREADIEEIRKVSDQLGLSPWTRVDYHEELRRTDSHLRVAMTGENIAGFLAARRVPGTKDGTFDVEVYNIGVRKEYQRTGVGRILISDLVAYAQNYPVYYIWLEVRRKNFSAIAFYLSFGFEECGIRRAFYLHPPDDAVTMRLQLESQKS